MKLRQFHHYQYREFLQQNPLSQLHHRHLRQMGYRYFLLHHQQILD
jgi:hypothetical protein